MSLETERKFIVEKLEKLLIAGLFWRALAVLYGDLSTK